MSVQYSSLDRRTHSVIFLASLIIAISLLGSVAAGFGPIAVPMTVVDAFADILVQG
jgi:hypothetical protein